MPPKQSNTNKEDTRRRNPSRGVQKGMVGDIADAFKKQMEASSNSLSPVNSPARKRGNPQKLNGNKDLEVEKSNLRHTGETTPNADNNQALNEHVDRHAVNAGDQSVMEQAVNNTKAQATLNESENRGGDNTPLKEVAHSASNDNKKGDALNSTTQTSEDQVLEALDEITSRLTKLEETVYHPKNGLEFQLGKIIEKVNNIHTDIHSASAGLLVKTNNMSKTMEAHGQQLETMQQNQDRMTELFKQYKKLGKDLTLLQGLMQKFSQQSKQTASRVLDLTKRGMEQNLIIYGIDETKDPKANEECKLVVKSFLREKLELDIPQQHIWKAHRIGYRQTAKVRPMVIKVAYEVKESIMENMSKLKGLTNPTTGHALFISEQIPEGVAENKKYISAKLKTLNQDNNAKPAKERADIRVAGDKIIVNGSPFMEEVTPPEPADLFVDSQKQIEINKMNKKILEAEPEEANNSIFIGLAVHLKSIAEVNLAYRAVAQRFPAADHIMVAYGLRENDTFKHGNCDDGEYGGSARIKKILTERKTKDTAAFVVRKFGGVHIGVNRFKMIEKATNNALNLLDV